MRRYGSDFRRVDFDFDKIIHSIFNTPIKISRFKLSKALVVDVVK